MEDRKERTNNPIGDYKRVTELVLSWEKSTDDYKDGLSRLGTMLEWVREEINKMGLDPKELEIQAIELKDKYEGDILPSLTYLSQFTPVYSEKGHDFVKEEKQKAEETERIIEKEKRK